MKIHVLGVGGAGMMGIAELAMERGAVTGTDLKMNRDVESLGKRGVKVYTKHSESNITDDISVVVKSGAVKEDNVEIQKARAKRIPVWNRMYALNRLVSNIDNVISVVGSCGKTSMVSILEYIFQKEDPTIYMGAKSKITNRFGKAGKRKFAICESCEYKGAFFEFQANYAVLTSVIKNHEDYFGDDIDSTTKVMNNFFELSGLKTVYMPYELKDKFKRLSNKYGIVTIGENKGDCQYLNVEYSNGETSFEVSKDGESLGKFSTNLFGTQYVEEIVLGIAIAFDLGIQLNDIKMSIKKINLPDRRMQVEYESENFIIINDNARIPKQIQTSLKAVCEVFPTSEVICIPGIWGRLNARSLDEFAETLKNLNSVFLPPLGDCAISKGGAELDDSVEQLKSRLKPFCVPVYENVEAAKIINRVKEVKANSPEVKIVVITLGYDKFNSMFRKLFVRLKEFMEYEQ